jgi:hypothetical protein
MEAKGMMLSKDSRVANLLYEFTMRVSRDRGCDLAQDMNGAYVPSYVGAPDYQAAIKKAVSVITEMHFRFDDIEGPAREIPIGSWDAYVTSVWPDFADRFPSKDELPSLVENGAVFFGPFAAFK